MREELGDAGHESRDKADKEDEVLQDYGVDPRRFKRRVRRQNALVFGGTR
jgi:hypothetical protein